jgi:LPS export ABC transporter protein LptC
MNYVRSFLVLLAIIFVASCDIDFQGKQERKELPDVIMGDFQYISSDSAGKREWELKASEAKMYHAQNRIHLHNLTMTFFNERNQAESFLSANLGFVNQATLNVYAEGNVKILSDNKAVLEANKVHWNNKKQLFYSEKDELVKVTRGNTIIYGYNMEADAQLQEVTLMQVTADVEEAQ